MCGRSLGKDLELMSDTPIEGVERTTNAVCECGSVRLQPVPDFLTGLIGGRLRSPQAIPRPNYYGIGRLLTGTKPTRADDGTPS